MKRQLIFLQSLIHQPAKTNKGQVICQILMDQKLWSVTFWSIICHIFIGIYSLKNSSDSAHDDRLVVRLRIFVLICFLFFLCLILKFAFVKEQFSLCSIAFTSIANISRCWGSFFTLNCHQRDEQSHQRNDSASNTLKLSPITCCQQHHCH